ncbi:Protein-lysine N-methyltransferase efm3 [Cyphellophora attinorum]|uniref:Protein-lysine N-methyltransferase efm3 n=1 Tax=Cyphellophora attinorum TaxID=1664694 RepID=A0A0N1NZ00_9EURO|nr:Protein-lysine N-methyltransferase efm3 [Phialophora attinorum]KPI41094.1 Protein-lysine N-methyltransferase efm3 [Phialophora attinorum]
MDRSLVEFYRKFKQQIDPPNVPSGAVLKNPDVQLALERHFFNVAAEDLSAYQAKILRTVVERIQTAITDPEEEEVSDHLMTLLATLPPSRTQLDLSKTLVSYFPPVSYDEDVQPINILEAKKIIGSGPNTGLRTWEASLRLAHYLYQKPHLTRSRSVLEVGAGTGFLSIFCAAYLCPARIVVTDGHDDVITSLRHNVALNKSSYDAANTRAPLVKKLFWADEDDMNAILNSQDDVEGELSPSSKIDLIIGADVTYHPDACLALASTLSVLAQRNPDATILISATQRNLETMEVFLDACRKTLSVEEVTDTEFKPLPFDRQTGCFHNVVSPIRIWRLRATTPPVQVE